MIKGSHNSATGHKLLGWQKYFSWIINPFTKCQSKTLREQVKAGIRLFDIQVNYKDGKWLASHGIAWYDVEPIKELYFLANEYGTTFDIILGYDYHYNHQYEYSLFAALLDDMNKRYYPQLKVVRVYHENPYECILNTLTQATEKYWTTSWAKSKMDKWWKFYYYLPIPILWKKLYGKIWDGVACTSSNQYYITDFV